ncbi:MAG: gluconate 2-dehydrogenase subunit 3 family protein [Myxococcota bacterium]|nr:gluconate 2-dehydrogenase subunit 3 family protein [Myxococcota bacterium]
MSQAESDSGFSRAQERALACVLDEIIPPSEDGRFPGAGELGLVSYVGERAADLVPMIVQGLSSLDELASGRGAADFAALPRGERRGVLEELTAREAGFLPLLLFHTFSGYYQQPPVLEALGLEARPPFPEGHEVEPNDHALLDPVRERGPVYRS